MPWPFIRGRIYSRREHIHRQFGGSPQGGIITFPKAPFVALITGRRGRNHSYVDVWRPDGVFEYAGQGRTGDQKFSRGNRAIAQHYEEGKDLLLFSINTGRTLRYEGEFICAGCRVETRMDVNMKPRQAIVFELVPTEAFNAMAENHISPGSPDLETLRNRALDAAQSNTGSHPGTRNIFTRSNDIKAYVLARAGGNCEGCDNPAPFERIDGTPYLEAHHTLRLSDAGPDHPEHVVALCPTCHRRVHYGFDGERYNDALKVRLKSVCT